MHAFAPRHRAQEHSARFIPGREHPPKSELLHLLSNFLSTYSSFSSGWQVTPDLRQRNRFLPDRQRPDGRSVLCLHAKVLATLRQSLHADPKRTQTFRCHRNTQEATTHRSWDLWAIEGRCRGNPEAGSQRRQGRQWPSSCVRQQRLQGHLLDWQQRRWCAQGASFDLKWRDRAWKWRCLVNTLFNQEFDQGKDRGDHF